MGLGLGLGLGQGQGHWLVGRARVRPGVTGYGRG